MSEKKISTAVVFSSINVNVLDDLSGIFIGDNQQCNWVTTNKTNSGFGTVLGKNNITYLTLNVVIDPDFIDNPTNLADSGIIEKIRESDVKNIPEASMEKEEHK